MNVVHFSCDSYQGFRHRGFVVTFVENNSTNRLSKIHLSLISVTSESATSTSSYISFTVYSRRTPPLKSYHYSPQVVLSGGWVRRDLGLSKTKRPRLEEGPWKNFILEFHVINIHPGKSVTYGFLDLWDPMFGDHEPSYTGHFRCGCLII